MLHPAADLSLTSVLPRPPASRSRPVRRIVAVAAICGIGTAGRWDREVPKGRVAYGLPSARIWVSACAAGRTMPGLVSR
jgi:hypothetical protein